MRAILALVTSLTLSLPMMAMAQNAPLQWEMTTEYPANTLPGEGIAIFAQLVTEKSGGRLVIRADFSKKPPPSSLDIFEAVKENRLQAGDMFGGAISKVDAYFGLASLPFVVSSLEDARRLSDIARPLYEGRFTANGQHLLYVTPWPPSGIWSKGTLTTKEDVAALLIRTYDDASQLVFKSTGSRAMNISFNEVDAKLAANEINAVLSSGDGGAGRKLWEYLPHFTAVNYSMPLSFATMNSGAYNALPVELKKVVDEAAAETQKRQWLALTTRLEENRRRMLDNNVKFNDNPAPEILQALRDAAKPVVESWKLKAGPAGATALEAFFKD